MIRKTLTSIIATCGLCLIATHVADAGPKKKQDAEPKGSLRSGPASAKPVPTSGASQKVENPVDKKLFDGSFSDAPTNISSDTLILRNNDRVFVYSGNVKVTQGDMTLTSKSLEGLYSEKNEIQRMIAKDDVVITKGEIKATGGKALYESATNTVLLTESPQVEQKGSLLTADRIRVFLDEDRSQAEGQVRVTLVKKNESGDEGATVVVKPTPTPQGTPASGSPAKEPPTSKHVLDAPK